MDREFWENDKNFKDNKKKKEQIAAEASKGRIKKKAKISVETCAIGSLSDFEETFGWLWGHGKEDSLTPKQKEMRDLWQEVRNSILDRAENSKRLLLREIDRCEFKEYNPPRFTTIIRPKRKDDWYGQE